jgi:endonuclease/exonuclease/phosphatase family metal-dependent hydrolase
MNVKSAPITTFCLALALVFYSFDLRQNEWTAAATAALPEGLVLKLPGLLCSCCLLLACSFFLLFERYNGTHNLCSPQAVASLPLWSELNAVRGTEVRTIRLMTINMLLRPPFINYNGDDYKNERLELLVRHVLPHYDIVALQEVFWFWNFRLGTLLKEAQAQGFHWYTNNAAPPLSSRKFIDGGLLILSRYPITETRKRIYTNGVQIDGWAAKQALYAKVHISPTTHIHVITTHTQADYATNSTNAKNATTRMSQIREIGELIHDVWCEDPQKSEVIVMGDLNVDGRAHDDEGRMAKRDKWGVWGEEDRDSEEYKIMMETFKRSVQGKSMDKPKKELNQIHHNNGCKAKECEPEEAKPRLVCTDLLREANKGINPVTIGDVTVLANGDIAPRETALTDPVTDMLSRSCLDYMIHFKQETILGEKPQQEEELEVVDSQVEPFFFDPRKLGGLPVTQLSDHYGLSTTINLKSRIMP